MVKRGSQSMLDYQKLLIGVQQLTQKDPHLHRVVKKYGPPPLWDREPGFASLIKIILEQQVSLASAQATYDKLYSLSNRLTPESYIALNADEIKSAGLTRQKTRYCRILAETILNGDLNLEELEEKDDSQVIELLTSITGIGPWTAGIYLLMALRRPDVWPPGDLALLSAMKEIKELPSVPTSIEGSMIAKRWKPWRSVAARILWHYYLSVR